MCIDVKIHISHFSYLSGRVVFHFTLSYSCQKLFEILAISALYVHCETFIGIALSVSGPVIRTKAIHSLSGTSFVELLSMKGISIGNEQVSAFPRHLYYKNCSDCSVSQSVSQSVRPLTFPL